MRDTTRAVLALLCEAVESPPEVPQEPRVALRQALRFLSEEVAFARRVLSSKSLREHPDVVAMALRRLECAHVRVELITLATHCP